jgi:hypothetical protein
VQDAILAGDAPYASAADAMRFWPETATAVAVRRTAEGPCEIAAPFGLEKLFGLVLRPVSRFRGESSRSLSIARGQRDCWKSGAAAPRRRGACLPGRWIDPTYIGNGSTRLVQT